MTDHFYVSQKFYDELVAQDPTYADTAIVSDKVEGYDVWPEHTHQLHVAVETIHDEIFRQFEPLMVKLAALCDLVVSK